MPTNPVVTELDCSDGERPTGKTEQRWASASQNARAAEFEPQTLSHTVFVNVTPSLQDDCRFHYNLLDRMLRISKSSIDNSGV